MQREPSPTLTVDHVKTAATEVFGQCSFSARLVNRNEFAIRHNGVVSEGLLDRLAVLLAPIRWWGMRPLREEDSSYRVELVVHVDAPPRAGG